MAHTINVKTVLSYLEVLFNSNLGYLKNQTLQFAVDNFLEIKDLEGWKPFESKHGEIVVEILKRTILKYVRSCQTFLREKEEHDRLRRGFDHYWELSRY
jgi:hypothetical protein